jgi:hypothetical protein
MTENDRAPREVEVGEGVERVGVGGDDCAVRRGREASSVRERVNRDVAPPVGTANARLLPPDPEEFEQRQPVAVGLLAEGPRLVGVHRRRVGPGRSGKRCAAEEDRSRRDQQYSQFPGVPPSLARTVAES